MIHEDLLALREELYERHSQLDQAIEDIQSAPSDKESEDHRSDTYAEAVFLRIFTAYEYDVERLFFHYVTGGSSLSGVTPHSYLNVSTERLAREIVHNGRQFLNWAKPNETRLTAKRFIKDGWPIYDLMNANSQVLHDCQRVRNRIAHRSIESKSSFDLVQRNLLKTERIFTITPGQLLRIRLKNHQNKLTISHFSDVIRDTVDAIIDAAA